MRDMISPGADAVVSREIIFTQKGAIGHVLLNRPKALNALTLGMCEALLHQLKAWRERDDVKAIVLRGAGEKAYCAGGDVIRLYEDGLAGGSYPKEFYNAEYRCDTALKTFPKPVIALMDGIVMGGGVGVSIHSSLRIVTDRTVFAMPETGIGLFPDVGGTYFLPRLAGGMGMYLGLTGRRLKGADCIMLGLAEVYMTHDKIDSFEEALTTATDLDGDIIADLITTFAETITEAPIQAEQGVIDHHFERETLEEIVDSLARDDGEWAKKTAANLAQKSPLSLKISARQLWEGRKLSFPEAMRLEWRLASRFAAGREFYEGVRALLVDKDMKPQWTHASLADVTPAEVDAYFAPLPGNELKLSDILSD